MYIILFVESNKCVFNTINYQAQPSPSLKPQLQAWLRLALGEDLKEALQEDDINLFS